MADYNEINEKKVPFLHPVDRRMFIKGAAGAALVAGSIGISPLLGIPAAAAAPVAGGARLQAASLNNITHYVGIRHVGPFNDVNSTWARLTQFAMQQGISGSNVIAYADVCPCDDLTAPILAAGTDVQLKAFYDACLAITAAQHKALTQQLAINPTDNFSGIRVGAITIGATNMIVHKGPYSTIGDTYRAALAAGATLNASIDGQPVAFEVYKNNPLLTKPEALLTEIHFPLSPIAMGRNSMITVA